MHFGEDLIEIIFLDPKDNFQKKSFHYLTESLAMTIWRATIQNQWRKKYWYIIAAVTDYELILKRVQFMYRNTGRAGFHQLCKLHKISLL